MKKVSAIDILALIACIIIAICCIGEALFDKSHMCQYCKGLIKAGDDCVICDGRYYYHPECYIKKLKEEEAHETH